MEDLAAFGFWAVVVICITYYEVQKLKNKS